jgi:5-methylcytosine-specific restriction endonuclease McrA
MTDPAWIEDLNTLMDRLALGEAASALGSLGGDYDYALQRAIRLLRAETEWQSVKRFELRLRLALHLCPASAVNYKATNPVPRHEIIEDFLRSKLERTSPHLSELARSLSQLLSNWQRRREKVTQYRDHLLGLQHWRCASCAYRFDRPSPFAESIDPYKPFADSPNELTSPEVDHIEAVSCFGTNELKNLQVLCRLCNFGKNDGLGLDVISEIEYAGEVLERIPLRHRAAMLFYVLERDGRRCSLCGLSGVELTIRPRVEGGSYARTNLMAICANCALSR